MWRAILLLLPALASCAPTGPAIDDEAARAHVEMLARRIGSRPIGSTANRQAREYVAGVLQTLGFAVRLQETDAVDAPRGLTAHVVNIIATKDAPIRDAVALVSHYDSVPDGPGAGDDALGVATCLESARLLVAGGLRHSLFVLVTDGEEVGLMGARAVATDPDVAARVRTFLNFDGTGAAGPTLLFETGPGWSPPLSAWRAGAPAPSGASFGIEIYRRLPNDTDFTVLKRLGSGLNFAPVGDSYAYHTDRDIAPHVDPYTLRHGIGNAVGTVRALDAMEWTAPAMEAPTYFDVFGRRAFVYGAALSAAIVWMSVAVAALGWMFLTRWIIREHRAAGAVATAAWASLSTAASVGGSVAAAWLVRALRSELNPWYATPSPFFFFVLTAGVLGGWLVHRLASLVPESWRPVRAPAAIWWVTLPVWIVFAIVLDIAAPAAAYLVAWPLLVAGAMAVVGHRSRLAMIAGSVVVLLVAVALWARNTWLLLGFMVPLFGWLPVVAPVWLYPALIATASLMIAPPALAPAAGVPVRSLRPGAIGLAIAALAIASGVLSLASPAYTTTRPQMRTVWYVQDDTAQQAWWEVGGNERSLDLAGPGPPGAEWHPVTDAVPSSVRLGPIGSPFAFRTATAPVVSSLPADVTSRIVTGADGRTRLDVTIVPRGPVTVRLSLPAGVRPANSTVAGAETAGVWRATYVAPPASGLDMHLEFDREAPEDLARSTVVLISAGVPDGAPGAWPAWLPQERATWRARTFIIRDLRQASGLGH
ncbi:MAG TPA: M28 family peptidase [Vicinamibacterales bacterium]|nr:M28 family peptidase [Vicinamibacterales bacterium]